MFSKFLLSIVLYGFLIEEAVFAYVAELVGVLELLSKSWSYFCPQKEVIHYFYCRRLSSCRYQNHAVFPISWIEHIPSLIGKVWSKWDRHEQSWQCAASKWRYIYTPNAWYLKFFGPLDLISTHVSYSPELSGGLICMESLVLRLNALMLFQKMHT